MTMSKIHITAFYLFFPWPEGTDFDQSATYLEAWCADRNIMGLLLIGPEGFNGTLATLNLGSMTELKTYFQTIIQQTVPNAKLEFKDSTSSFMPFRRMKVKIKKEIVTLGDPNVLPAAEKNSSHLSPKDWNEFIKSKNPVVLDVRNTYEMELGKFKTAKKWDMTEFTEFPDLVKSLNIPKSEPILMYCTGGIRCEKASLEMKNQGYQEVYQLDGGILNYLVQFPNDLFEGECFVFDHRVAVDQNLNPSEKYVLCHHCGQPAFINPFDCIQCGVKTNVCESCLEVHIQDLSIRTCSKNCRHHFKMGHKTLKPHLDSKRKYQDSIAKSQLQKNTFTASVKMKKNILDSNLINTEKS